MERPDLNELIPAIVQDAASGRVLMLAWMDEEALRRTRETGEAWFWSRSRQEYWHKGATSGNTMAVVEMRDDCDGDAILLRVDPAGPACHTGAESCFAPWLWRVVAERAQDEARRLVRRRAARARNPGRGPESGRGGRRGRAGGRVGLRRAPRRGARRPLVPQLRPPRGPRPRPRAGRRGAPAPPSQLTTPSTRRPAAAARGRRAGAASCPRAHGLRRRFPRPRSAREIAGGEREAPAARVAEPSTAGVSRLATSSGCSRQATSAGTRPRNGWTRKPVAFVSSGSSAASTSTSSGASPTSSSASRSAVARKSRSPGSGRPPGKPSWPPWTPRSVRRRSRIRSTPSASRNTGASTAASCRSARGQTSVRSRSSIVSRRRISRASPSPTSTAAGRVTPL